MLRIPQGEIRTKMFFRIRIQIRFFRRDLKSKLFQFSYFFRDYFAPTLISQSGHSRTAHRSRIREGERDRKGNYKAKIHAASKQQQWEEAMRFPSAKELDSVSFLPAAASQSI